MQQFQGWILSIGVAALLSTLLTLVLVTKSLKDFSRTGPQLRDEVLEHYRLELVLSIARLTAWTWLIAFYLAIVGTTTYWGLCTIRSLAPAFWPGLMAGVISVLIIVAYRFSYTLLFLPANIEASSNYRMSRFFSLWQLLSPARLQAAAWLLAAVPFTVWCVAAVTSAVRLDWVDALFFMALPTVSALIYIGARPNEPLPAKARTRGEQLNILMIGSDSLRADRVASGYHRDLTPFLDQLAKKGTHFTNCFVPCARTAPSLASMLSGTWPQRHGIRDNFVSDTEFTMNGVPSMVKDLRKAGYRTVAISDWCGADLGKLQFGFEECNLPSDQWNIKYLLRQGPKDIRLFLSLFIRNRLGKRCLPELYYLAGVPSTTLVGRDTRAALSEAAMDGRPFLINAFMSTTHGPFGSEYPHYTQFPGTEYTGNSKYVMSGLNEPFEVVRQQGYSKDKFDLTQIVDLYDGCVQNFDAEVKKIVNHVAQCGLMQNTIIVIYSDHGMEFFERGTWGQGNSVIVDDSARIPLIVVDPRSPEGKTIAEVARSVDIAPTLLGLAGQQHMPDGFDGVSLAGVIRGKDTMPELSAYYETGIWFTKIPVLGTDHLHYPELPELLEVQNKVTATIGLKPSMHKLIIDAKDRAFRIGRWKLVRLACKHGPEWLLYDMENDPECTLDVGSRFPDIAESLQVQGAAFWLD
ncbi:MAG: sulfatase family protein [Thiobacillus sp.]